jgi:predicted nucleic acid-binding Zn ribbon protein
MDPMLPDHDHCRYCGDAVPFEQAYCCEECYYADQKRIRSGRIKDITMAAVAVAGIVVVLVLGYLF